MAATVVGVSTVGCAPPPSSGEKNNFELYISPTATVLSTPTEEPASIPTSTLTPTQLPTRTATSTLSPTVTETLTPTPTLAPTFKSTLTFSPVITKETEIKVVYPITKGNSNRPEISLTIDDGYDKPAVEKMLKILKERNIKATFFVIGQCLEKDPDLWKRALVDGHQICNHSATHAKEWKDWISAEKVREEILGWEKSAVKILGKEYLAKMKTEFPYVRFPYGSGNRTSEILKIAEDLGYIVIGWNSYGDGGNGSIVLFHFIPTDADKLERVLDGIAKRGLKAVTVSEVLR